MVTRADITTGTRPAAAIEAPTPVAASATVRHETFSRLSQIMLGRQLQAEVLSRFDDGTYLVRVADTAARMALPQDTRVGGNLSMTMLAHEPRPTFLLNTEPGSASATLSNAGRLIDTVLQAAQRGGEQATITAQEPLLPSPAALHAEGAAPELARTLRDTLTYSGLFYESHLQEWVDGARPRAELMREPQAALRNPGVFYEVYLREGGAGTPPRAELIPEPQTNLPHAGQPALLPPLAPAGAGKPPALENNLQPSLAQLLGSAQPITANPAVVDADTMLLPPAARSQIAESPSMQWLPQQLHALEQREVVWRSELFPGQPMEWMIRDDTPRQESGGRPDQELQQWQSAVRFELPALGTVSATIVMTGDHVQIHVRTASEDSATALRAHGQELRDALGAAGTPLDSLLIKQDEQA